ncbi:ribonuclease D [Tatumella citrea]|uniref:Ribonuclease D n=1 Tax=Tatumella citrea TaxID=53336 RepID=A0A1Y0LJE3_TATCI|nr:ribonuclease D [Tatumella citrea]ARU94173.1 ribonuclease D [Tatumella citrea]ARU98213.1 ribonuclease D [Tatumella citrea]
MNYQLIDTDQQLAQVCQAALNHSAVALDTEFVRTRTYYPQLGLIQLFDGEAVTLIDPLTITDWSPFITLLTDTRVVKYLHAGGEDLEVFLNRFSVLPTPMVDTQILAAFLGYPMSLGFAAMVAEFTGVELDKSESRTDWLARPLTERQCEYAAADVEYLLPIALKLHQQASEQQVLSKALSECEMLCERRQDILPAEYAWAEISQACQLRPRQLVALQKLAGWRLTYARRKDMAVNFVVKEEHLWKVARYLPGSLGELQQLGLIGPEIRFHGQTMLQLVAEALEEPEEQLPAVMKNLIDCPGYKSLFKDLKACIKQISEQTGFSQELLASRRQINQVLSAHWQIKPREKTPELLKGWRGELMAEKIAAIINVK